MSRPRFTVVVPTFGRPERLLRCVRAIDELRFDGFDILISDDGSPDPVEPVLTRETWSHDLGVVHGPNAGPGAARNRAAHEAAGEYLAFTADDCEPDQAWLDSLGRAFAIPGNECSLVGGTILHALPRDWCATASHLLIDYMWHVFNHKTPTFFTPNNLAVHAESFREAGGFDDTIGPTGEDRELCARWLSQGRTIAWAEDAIVTHAHPLTFSGYLRQQYAYGVGSARYRKRIEAAANGAIPQPVGFYVGLLAHPFRRERGVRAVPLSALLLAGQVCNAMGVLLESRRGES